MFLRKVLDIILIFTLPVQLFPTTQSGRLLIFEVDDEECMNASDNSNHQLRTIDEEQHKDLHIEHAFVLRPIISVRNKNYHFTEMIPPPHYTSILSPPPNFIA